MTVQYKAGSSLPNVELTWKDSDGNVRDFSAGWTFTARVGTAGQAALIQKTTGITGAAVAPNVVIAWADGELDVLPSGAHTVDVVATYAATGQRLIQSFDIYIQPAVLPMV